MMGPRVPCNVDGLPGPDADAGVRSLDDALASSDGEPCRERADSRSFNRRVRNNCSNRKRRSWAHSSPWSPSSCPGICPRSAPFMSKLEGALESDADAVCEFSGGLGAATNGLIVGCRRRQQHTPQPRPLRTGVCSVFLVRRLVAVVVAQLGTETKLSVSQDC